jgi:hypothetical protein
MEAAYRSSGNKGVWIADRGYDNKKVLDRLLDRKTVFVIMSRWSGCEDPIRFLKQTFRMEKFLIDGISAIRAWFFGIWGSDKEGGKLGNHFISVAFSILFEIESWGKILQWMVKLSQPFAKDVQFNYYRIFRGLKEFLYLFLTSLLPPPRSP